MDSSVVATWAKTGSPATPKYPFGLVGLACPRLLIVFLPPVVESRRRDQKRASLAGESAISDQYETESPLNLTVR